MDSLINKGKQALSGGGGHSTAGQPAGGAQGKPDAVDKGINSIQAKLGMDKDGKYDKYEEKATDFGRSQYEKKTGKHVSDKISN